MLMDIKWLSTKEQFPPQDADETGHPVLTINKNGYYKVAVYSREEDCWYDADDVVYWTYLPKCPKISVKE